MNLVLPKHCQHWTLAPISVVIGSVILWLDSSPITFYRRTTEITEKMRYYPIIVSAEIHTSVLAIYTIRCMNDPGLTWDRHFCFCSLRHLEFNDCFRKILLFLNLIVLVKLGACNLKMHLWHVDLTSLNLLQHKNITLHRSWCTRPFLFYVM